MAMPDIALWPYVLRLSLSTPGSTRRLKPFTTFNLQACFAPILQKLVSAESLLSRLQSKWQCRQSC